MFILCSSASIFWHDRTGTECECFFLSILELFFCQGSAGIVSWIASDRQSKKKRRQEINILVVVLTYYACIYVDGTHLLLNTINSVLRQLFSSFYSPVCANLWWCGEELYKFTLLSLYLHSYLSVRECVYVCRVVECVYLCIFLSRFLYLTVLRSLFGFIVWRILLTLLSNYLLSHFVFFVLFYFIWVLVFSWHASHHLWSLFPWFLLLSLLHYFFKILYAPRTLHDRRECRF